MTDTWKCNLSKQLKKITKLVFFILLNEFLPLLALLVALQLTLKSGSGARQESLRLQKRLRLKKTKNIKLNKKKNVYTFEEKST